MAKLKRERPEPRDKVIQVRVTTAEAEYLQAAADRRSISVADLIRAALDAYPLAGRKAR